MRSDLTYASCVGIILLVEPRGVVPCNSEKSYINMTKLGKITTVEDYFKYRRAHMHDLSLRERHLLMAWLNRSEVVRLKGKRHKETIHSEIEMR